MGEEENKVSARDGKTTRDGDDDKRDEGDDGKRCRMPKDDVGKGGKGRKEGSRAESIDIGMPREREAEKSTAPSHNTQLTSEP